MFLRNIWEASVLSKSNQRELCKNTVLFAKYSRLMMATFIMIAELCQICLALIIMKPEILKICDVTKQNFSEENISLFSNSIRSNKNNLV